MKNRIFRVLVCLVVICALLVNVSPIRAKATGLVEGLVIAGASVVNVPAALVTIATLICLGLMADATAQNPFLLQDIANSCQEHLAATGTLIKDGTVELLRCVTATGEAIYYVGSNFMEAVRSWLFDSETVTAKELVLYPEVSVPADALATAMAAPYAFFSYTETVSGAYAGSMSYVLCYSYESPIEAIVSSSTGNGYTIRCVDKAATIYSYVPFGYWNTCTGTAIGQNTSMRLVGPYWCGTADAAEFVTSYDLELGVLLTVPIDGTSARAWSEEYANRGLYVVPGSGTGGNEGQDGSWFWPLALTLSIAELLAMIQAEQWISQTPPEFDDYTTEEELEVTPAPEFEGYPSIEVSPAPSPNPNPGGTPGTGDDTDPDPTEVPNPDVTPDPGTGTNPNPGTCTDPDPNPNPDPDSGTDTENNPIKDFANVSPGDFVFDVPWMDFFPFCIPKDILDLVRVFNAEPEAPRFVFDIDFPYMDEPWHIDIDFSAWDPVALVLRRLELLLFVVGLAMATRNYYIRG